MDRGWKRAWFGYDIIFLPTESLCVVESILMNLYVSLSCRHMKHELKYI